MAPTIEEIWYVPSSFAVPRREMSEPDVKPAFAHQFELMSLRVIRLPFVMLRLPLIAVFTGLRAITGSSKVAVTDLWIVAEYVCVEAKPWMLWRTSTVLSVVLIPSTA